MVCIPMAWRLSAHLASRKEVGDILLASSTPTLVLQAGVVIGAGSASFEMVRHLTEVLPFMPAPRWVMNRIQPIAVRDVLHYLLAATRLDDATNRAFDIGGPDVMRYADMMNRYAAIAGLPRRRILPLPVLTPGLASHWVGLVTPVPRRIARPLVESLLHSCVVKSRDIDQVIAPPPEGLTGYEEAVRWALGRLEPMPSKPVGKTHRCVARPAIRSPAIPTGQAGPSSPTSGIGTRPRAPAPSGRSSSRSAVPRAGTRHRHCGRPGG
ncbi:hypothetical protein GCM10025876_37770 [Demequina litorisediminis]|uniref:Uncharacterized protein n=1 Tax=Demequina litorisediminis TaxID=1849022 RepID=A0ABQ6IKA1_9MICO|nr:hypothetical protein GCM10025876_37770 [Demequina litorisediminis]